MAIFTSGGDAPGMNAAIRAVVRTGNHFGIEVCGIRHGYEGMINNDFITLHNHDVSGIIHKGGTILKTTRSERFMTPDGQALAAKNLINNNIDGLIALGGDGTFKGSLVLRKICNIPVIGIPTTIDDDLYGTDYTIGFDTAINTVIEAVDKIRDTADAHDRLFFVEVMGNDAGQIALRTGIATGAVAILIPETPTNIENLINMLRNGWKRKKSSKIIIVAEGDEAGGAFDMAKKVKLEFPIMDTRVTILGHIQRGGNPSCMDRYRASYLGYEAVKGLISGMDGVMAGLKNEAISFEPLENAVKYKATIQTDVLEMISILSS